MICKEQYFRKDEADERMKHRLKSIRPPATPRLAMTITLTIIVGILAALTVIVSNVASTTLPDVLKPYAGYSWPLLCALLVLGIVFAAWQAWYNSGQPANNAALSASATQPSGVTSIIMPTSQSAQSTTAPSSSNQTTQPTTTASQQSTPQPVGATTPSQPLSSHHTPSTATSLALAPGSAHYHTCVISYSTDDELFVAKLYADLKAHGVPCWLADQDIKLGDKLRAEIYQAIGQLDKLLLVLSKNAIESKWVEEEVDVALDREHQQSGTFLLFPLRLDNEVLTTNKYWAINVRQRRIGDFRQWQLDAEYQQALQRVLRDLQV